MKFSILVANYNNGQYFVDCYNSIVSQTYSDWEVIIVDDASTDNSIDLIQKSIAGDARFRLFSNKQNMGCGFTKRKCVDLAMGEVCGFVDPDDAITQDAIELMMQTHVHDTDAVLVHSSFFYCNDLLQKISKFNLARAIDKNELFTNLDGGVTQFATFKKRFYVLTEGINADFRRAVDQDLYLKLFEVGKFVFVNECLYSYRIHQNGISSNNATKAFYNHLKALASAEIRRGTTFEKEVEPYLNGDQCNRNYYELQLNNPRLLAQRTWIIFKNNPIPFLKKLFSKSI